MSSNWIKNNLRDLVVISYGKSPKDILAGDGVFPVVGTGGIERFGHSYLYDGESIVLGRKGTIDNPVYINGKFWAIDTTYFLTDFKDTDVKWLFYYLKTIDFRSMSEATGVLSLSRDYLYSIEIKTPPKKEQTQIAAVLSCIDRQIEATERLIAKHERIKTGLMQDLLTRGIDRDGNIRSEQTHEFKDSPLGRIPKEWDAVELKYFIEKLESGVSVNSEDKPAGAGQLAVLKTSALTGCVFKPYQNKTVEERKEIKRLKCPVRKGSIIISRMNTPELVGENALVESNYPNLFLPDRLWQTVFRKSVNLNVFWLAKLLSSKEYRTKISFLATGTSNSMKNITKDDFLNLLIAKPDFDEQNLIAECFGKTEETLLSFQKQLEKFKVIKTGLMQDLLTGNVPVVSLLSESENGFHHDSAAIGGID